MPPELSSRPQSHYSRGPHISAMRANTAMLRADVYGARTRRFVIASVESSSVFLRIRIFSSPRSTPARDAFHLTAAGRIAKIALVPRGNFPETLRIARWHDEYFYLLYTYSRTDSRTFDKSLERRRDTIAMPHEIPRDSRFDEYIRYRRI